MTTMPEGLDPSLADALLLLAADEGQDLNAYARRAGVSNAVMANYLTELSDRARYCEPPGLVIWQPHSLGAPNVPGVLNAEGRARREAIARGAGPSQSRRFGRGNLGELSGLNRPCLDVGLRSKAATRRADPPSSGVLLLVGGVDRLDPDPRSLS
jgi:hypothetical protein